MASFSTAGVRNTIVISAISRHLSFPKGLPPLREASWHNVGRCSRYRKLTESKGDAVITAGLGEFIRRHCPDLSPEGQECVLQALTQNLVFHHIMVRAEKYDGGYRKAAGNVLEIIISAWAEYATPCQLQRWIRGTFLPLVDLAVHEYRTYDHSLPPHQSVKRQQETTAEYASQPSLKRTRCESRSLSVAGGITNIGIG
ncbi:hypothetical protein C8R43DRAFT_1128924 [Mycena crocata]|nr:hypothetical protein C8R43DRAFT_1128924 [Mycena crocata]